MTTRQPMELVDYVSVLTEHRSRAKRYQVPRGQSRQRREPRHQSPAAPRPTLGPGLPAWA
jgi:hypothetical protein